MRLVPLVAVAIIGPCRHRRQRRPPLAARIPQDRFRDDHRPDRRDRRRDPPRQHPRHRRAMIPRREGRYRRARARDREDRRGAAARNPVRYLTWHEIANDEAGGVPFAVTFCPLCNSGPVFDRRLDGEVLSFGVSGKLRHSDMVMYDREPRAGGSRPSEPGSWAFMPGRSSAWPGWKAGTSSAPATPRAS